MNPWPIFFPLDNLGMKNGSLCGIFDAEAWFHVLSRMDNEARDSTGVYFLIVKGGGGSVDTWRLLLIN